MRLIRRGHTIDIYRLGPAHADSTSDSAYGLRAEILPYSGTRHRRGGVYFNDWLTWKDRKRQESAERNLASRINAIGYDVVLASVLGSGISPNLLRFATVPTVYYCHEPPRRFYEPWCRPGAAPLSLFERARMVWRWPTQFVLDRHAQRQDRSNVAAATAILTNSRYTQARIREVYRRESVLCYLGVDNAAFTPAGSARASGVVSVGALEAHKGFDFLLIALGLVPPGLRPPITIVGSGGHPRMGDHLQSTARKLNIDLRIITGLSDVELAELYRSAAAFVFGARMEPFGLVLLEAMASGLPVVAVAEGGVPEVVRDGVTGFLTRRDPNMFAHRLSTLLTDHQLRQRMAIASRQEATANWRWETSCSRVEELLRQVASGKVTAP